MKRNKYKTILFAAAVLLLFTACHSPMPEPVITINLSRLEIFTPDGIPDEWHKIESSRLWADPLGGYPDPPDLEASMKASWNDKSLYLLIEVSDDSFLGDALNPWNGDAIEVFLSPYRGSQNITQISIVPLPEKDFVRINNQVYDSLSKIFSGEIHSITRIDGKKRTTEIEIGLNNNNNIEAKIPDFALQVYVDDADTENREKSQLVWFPAGQSYNSSSSMYPVKFGEMMQKVPKGSSRLVITDNKKISLYVFGAKRRDKIGIYRNGKFLGNLRSVSGYTYKPDTLDISSYGWDIENDTLFVTLRGESLGFHEYLIAPRVYEKLEEKRFEREIRNFIFMDRQKFPPENATLFIGSSSIVRWETLKKDFPELQIIKRGFGGSTSPEALMYINQIALPYKPSEIVYYEGDNDIVMGLSPEVIRDNVKTFITQVATALPDTRIYIISPKPSINRMQFWETYKQTHVLLNKLADEYDKVEFVDVASPMFDKNGNLNKSLFVEDGIHMNEAGYAIWTKVIRKALELDK
jgi:lysophospholipase L1-like esterase